MIISQLYKPSIQKLLLHIGHIGTSKKIYPMQSFSINLDFCPKDLMNDPDHTCHYCYVKHSNLWRFWKHILDENTKLIQNDPLWVTAISFYINKVGRNNQFRFWVAGEFKDYKMFKKVMQVVKNCPNCTFWIPTTKHDLVFRYIEEFGKPKNASINLSYTFIHNPIPKKLIRKAVKYDLKITHAVIDDKEVNCHANLNESGNCEYCSNCIDVPGKENRVINYKLKHNGKNLEEVI